MMPTNRQTHDSLWHAAMTVVAVALLSGLPVRAQDDGGNPSATEIAPYTGPPIFLEEPEPQPPARLVERREVTEDYEDGTPRIERQIARFSDDSLEADGFYREYYPNGQLFVEGQYRNGAQHGEWTYWYEDGTRNRTAEYENGLPHGTWEVYREDGTLSGQRGYQNGQRHGEWLTFDETGEQLLREQHYNAGVPDGVWKSWYPNGQLRQELTFRDGQRHGEAREWYEDGSKRVELTYSEGKPHGIATVWAPDGREFVREFDQGKLIQQAEEEE